MKKDRKYLIMLFLAFVAILPVKASVYYTMTVGQIKTLTVYASPSSNHYVSSYHWSFPGVGVTCVGGGSYFDSSCSIQAILPTKYVTEGKVMVRCSWYQKEFGSMIERFGGDEFFYITVNESSSGGGEDGGSMIEVLSSSLADGEMDVALDVKPKLVFNQAVSGNIKSSSSQRARLEASNGSIIYFNIHYSSVIHPDGTSEGEATYTPQKALQPATLYTFILPKGTIVDRSDAPNANEYRFSFTTKAADGPATSIIIGYEQESKYKRSIYNIEGKKETSLRKGINIVKGKKIFVK